MATVARKVDLIGQLGDIVGAKNVLVDAVDTAPYLVDERQRYRGAARAVVRPATTAEVAAVVRACRAAGSAIVPQGGNTGLCGAATPEEGFDGIVL